MSEIKHALKQVAVAVRCTVVEGWRLSRVMMLLITGLFAVVALIPAAQIILLSSITSAVESQTKLMVMLVLLAVLIGVGQVSGPVSTYFAEIFGQRQGLRQQRRFLDAVSSIPPQRLARPEVTAEIQAARNERYALSQYLFDLIATMGSIISTGGVCIAVLSIDTGAGILVIAAIVPLLLVASWSSRLVDRTWAKLGEHQRRSDYGIEQLVMQRSGTELSILGTGFRFADLAHTHLDLYNRLFLSMRLKTAFADVLGSLATATFLAFALLSLAGDAIAGENIAAGILGVISGMAATSAAGHHIGALVRDAPKAARFHAFLESAPHCARQGKPDSISTLETKNLRVAYGEHIAVEDATIHVRKGELVALVGPNGSGKTSVINAILGVVDVAGGEVCLDNLDAKTMSASERLSYFAHLSQEFGRYEVSVREALLLGVPGQEPTDKEMWSALDRANISALVRSWPAGLDTVLGEQWDGVGISGGQWQRVALARVYMRQSPVLILDEPTSAIDAEAESQIFGELRAGSAERLTILVTHRAWTLRAVDRIYVMDSGKIIESGSYAELLQGGGRFAEMFAEQLGVDDGSRTVLDDEGIQSTRIGD